MHRPRRGGEGFEESTLQEHCPANLVLPCNSVFAFRQQVQQRTVPKVIGLLGPAGSWFKLAEKIPCAVVLPKVIKCDSKTAFHLSSFWDIILLKDTIEEMRVGEDPQVSQCLAVSHLVPDRHGSTHSWSLPGMERADPAILQMDADPLQHFDLTGGKMPSYFHTGPSQCYLSLS